MEVDKVSIHYGAKEAVKSVSLPIRQGEVLSLIGPSGCGKTTLLRSLNRLTELTSAAKLTGSIRLDDVDIRLIEPTLLRRRVTMVFQQPNPFPMSIFDNIAYVIREQGSRKMKKKVLEPQVHSALGSARFSSRSSAARRRPAHRIFTSRPEPRLPSASFAISCRWRRRPPRSSGSSAF